MSVTAWDVLGLAETDDVRSIKRAYAQRLKTTRPEDDAAAFQLLTDAYEWALGYVRHRAREQAKEASAETPPTDAVQETVPGAAVAGVASSGAMPEAADAGAVPESGDAPQTAETAEEQGGFHFSPFFDGLVEQLRKPDPRHLTQWLEAHPDLYSIELKWALIPHVFDTLAHNAPQLDPHRGHVDALQAFFGVDARLRRHPAVAPAIDYLEAQGWKQNQAAATPAPKQPLPAGWEDLGKVMENSRTGPSSGHRNSSGSVPVWAVIVGVLVLMRFASLMTSG